MKQNPDSVSGHWAFIFLIEDGFCIVWIGFILHILQVETFTDQNIPRETPLDTIGFALSGDILTLKMEIVDACSPFFSSF